VPLRSAHPKPSPPLAGPDPRQAALSLA